eukprot:contig_5394_g1217
MQSQFILDNSMSRTLWQRVRSLLGGPASGLASRELLRLDLRTAQAEARNLVMSDGQGAFLVTPRAAVQGLLDDLLAVGQFLERPLRGPDGKEINAVSEFGDQEKPGDLPDPAGIETVCSYNGLTRAQGYATDLADVLRHSVRVKPKP